MMLAGMFAAGERVELVDGEILHLQSGRDRGRHAFQPVPDVLPFELPVLFQRAPLRKKSAALT